MVPYPNPQLQPSQPQPHKPSHDEKLIQCYSCQTVYPVPVHAGCTICPSCGQRSCSE